MNRARVEHGGVTPFPSLESERKRARERFGIDIDESLRAWFTDLGLDPERREELLAKAIDYAHFGGHPGTAPPDEELVLTARQRECLALAACGYTRKQIGELLWIGEETVKRHLDIARARLRASTVAHAVLLAALVGELDDGYLREHLLRGWEV